MAGRQNNCESYFDLLKKNSLFEDAAHQSMLWLSEKCEMKYFLKGKDDIGHEKNFYKFCFIIRGKVKVFNLNSTDKQFTLFILSIHDVFDIFTLINNQPHHVCYEILEDLQVLVIPTDILRFWLKENPLTLHCFFKYTIQQFQLLESHILDVGTNQITARLANLLLQYYNVPNQKIESIDDLTHDELAQLIGTSRAVFNRHIQHFKKLGIIKVRRKHIEILNLPRLKELCELRDPLI